MALQKVLLFSLAAQTIQAIALPALSLNKRDPACYDGSGYIDDGNGPGTICTTYCEHTSQQITGPPQSVSDDITCDTETCPAAVSNTYTSSRSFSISIGGNAAIMGGASVGANWNWETSTATSNDYTFTLQDGDAGNIVFRPYYHQSCGNMKYFADVTTGGGDGMAGTDACLDDAYAEDGNACGQTPVMNGEFADGDFTFCYSNGPRAGQGC